jgi:transposase
MAMSTTVGIDISKAKFDIALLRDGKFLSKVFANTASGHTELLKWLSNKGAQQSDCHLCMEATSTYYEGLALYLQGAGWMVSVVNPLQIKHFAQAQLARQKTDRADARVIAQFCAQHRPQAWQPPTPEVRELQRLLARLEAIQGMRVQEQNRLHEAQGMARESVQRVLQVLDAELQALEQLIDEHIDRHPGLRVQRELLQTIPAVGPRLSAYFIAWLPVERLSDARQAVAFVGLSPRAHESGQSVRGKASLCKLGHARLRKLLYLPAMCATRCNLAAQALAKRLRAAGKPGKLIIGAIMRKLVHWMFGVLKSARPFDVQRALARQ